MSKNLIITYETNIQSKNKYATAMIAISPSEQWNLKKRSWLKKIQLPNSRKVSLFLYHILILHADLVLNIVMRSNLQFQGHDLIHLRKLAHACTMQLDITDTQ